MGLLKTFNSKKVGLREKSKSKITLTSLIAYLAMIMFFSNSAVVEGKMAKDFTISINTIYHVFYGDEKIGIVDNQEIIRNFERDIVTQLKDQFEELDFSLSHEITMIPERVFRSRAYNSRTLANLEEIVNVSVETYEIVIGDEVIAHVSQDENMEEFKNNLIFEYVSEEEFEKYEQFISDEDFDYEDLEIGESIIKDIRFSKEVEWNESTAHPDYMMSVDDVLTMIKQGTLEEEVYTVQQGDVLGTIAEDHDLSIDEILFINPDINENTLLQIGDKLNVTVLKPMVDVIVEKFTKKEETIPFTTETKEDSSIWKGNAKVTREGENGKKVVEYATIYKNGRTLNKETISEDVIMEPTSKVVVKGTKTSPSRGTGKLVWPTVGGYISSYQGYRWGSYHKGIDIARPSNYAILAADNGTVKSAGWRNSYGYMIVINHNNGMETRYAHLPKINVSVGQTVGRGQQIGVMGSTGNSTGTHLHFEVYQNGSLKNPMDYLR